MGVRLPGDFVLDKSINDEWNFEEGGLASLACSYGSIGGKKGWDEILDDYMNEEVETFITSKLEGLEGRVGVGRPWPFEVLLEALTSHINASSSCSPKLYVWPFLCL